MLPSNIIVDNDGDLETKGLRSTGLEQQKQRLFMALAPARQQCVSSEGFLTQLSHTVESCDPNLSM